MTSLTTEQCAEIQALRRAGMNVRAIVIAMRRYHGIFVSYRQVEYQLRKAGVQCPKRPAHRIAA